MNKSDIGMVGLAVMGENLALNLLSKGFSVTVYNRSPEKTAHFLSRVRDGMHTSAAHSYEQLAASLAAPRKIMLMVKAGPPVDEVISGLLPYLEKGDIIIDGGNSFYQDTRRRCDYLAGQGILYVGCGISGGESGALHGPSMMPGGDVRAWPEIKNILRKISAKAEDGAPCCNWIGASGSGHYTKMVHNGIEYGDMQLICEAYQLMRDVCRMEADSIAAAFERWNQTELNSYLVEITAGILKVKDADGEPLVDKVADRAKQKGTGKWTSVSALDEGVPLPLITEAVFARCLSGRTGQREAAKALFSAPTPEFKGDFTLEDVRKALLASKIISYAQGFELLAAASADFAWDLDLGEIALLWRSGCIIRSPMLNEIKRAYEQDKSLSNILFSPYFSALIRECIPSLRAVVSAGARYMAPIPAMSSALAYFDGLSAERLSANLLQAQRDCFGAHSYERVDREPGQVFHSNWM